MSNDANGSKHGQLLLENFQIHVISRVSSDHGIAIS